jgi:hypothetical protein
MAGLYLGIAITGVNALIATALIIALFEAPRWRAPVST